MIDRLLMQLASRTLTKRRSEDEPGRCLLGPARWLARWVERSDTHQLRGAVLGQTGHNVGTARPKTSVRIRPFNPQRGRHLGHPIYFGISEISLARALRTSRTRG